MLMTWLEMMVPLMLIAVVTLVWGSYPRAHVAIGGAEGRFITGRRALRQRCIGERWGEVYGCGSFPEGL